MAEFPHLEELVVGLHERGEIGYVNSPEDFITLKSGRQSPNYVSTRDIMSFSDSLPISIERQQRVAELTVKAYAHGLDEISNTVGNPGDAADPFEHIVGLPQAVTTVVGAVGYERRTSVLTIRVPEGEKGYGKHKPIQGTFKEGDRAYALDNVISDGGTKSEYTGPLEAAGLVLPGFLVLVDREEGGEQSLLENGYMLYRVVGMGAATRILLDNKRIRPDQAEWSFDYIARYGSKTV